MKGMKINMEDLNKLTIEQINVLNEAMGYGIDIRELCDYRYNPENMRILLRLKHEGYNITSLLDPSLSPELLKIYASAIAENVSIEGLVNSNFTKKQLKSLIQLKKEGYDFSKCPGILDPEFTDDYLTAITHKHNLSPDIKPKQIYKQTSIVGIRKYIGEYNRFAKLVTDTKKEMQKKLK